MSKINDNLNRSLVAALAYCDLKSLPKKDSKDLVLYPRPMVPKAMYC